MEQAQPRIRPVEVTDHAGVLALAHHPTTGIASWRDPHVVVGVVQDWVIASLDRADPDSAPAWVATDGANVVGFVTAGARKHWSGDTDAYVGELVVDKEWSGRGVGQALMQSAQDWARDAGHARLTLETGAASHAARAFYAAAGYVEEEVVLTRAL